ncbi:MAG: hypothetical protein ACOH16_01675 [Propionibacteriaceae bacterium]
MSMYLSIASTITKMEADNNLTTARVETLAVVEVRTPVRTTLAVALRGVAELQLRLAARLDGRSRFAGRHAAASM